MSDETAASPAVAAAAASPHDHLSGVDIGRVMASSGPTVKCVLLRAPSGKANDDGKPEAEEVDSSKDVASMSVKEIKRELNSYGIDGSKFVEKPELVAALEGARKNVKGKPAAADEAKANDDDNGEEAKEACNGGEPKIVPLQHLIEEVDVDTTPRKSEVAKLLGGDFTFLGQYEDEGIMVMVRRPDWEADEDFPEEDVPPVNPHGLQPPLHNYEVRGDILLMRVAPTEEELDYEKEVVDATDDAKEGAEGSNGEKKGDGQGEKAADGGKGGEGSPEIHVPTNDEFFLDYTREEYLKFAARTDIEVPEESDESSGEEEEEEVEKGGKKAEAGDDDNDHDEDFNPEDELDSDDDLESEEHQVGMMNMILSHMLRRFREENGRGPDSLELLEMRKALADRLGVDVPPVDEEANDWEKKSPKAKEGTPGKKVIVDEEKNKTEEIPHREDDAEEGENGEEGADKKRPVEEIGGAGGEEPQEESNKKAKTNGEGAGEEAS